MNGCAANRPSSGFTLIEVVIALALLSLIMLGLLGALRAFGEVGTRVEDRSQRGDEMRLVPPLLEQVLGSASPSPRVGGAINEAWFQGRNDRIDWVGVMPARHGFGGLSHFRLAPMEINGSLALGINVTPFVSHDVAPDWQDFEAQVMVSRLAHLAIRYRAYEGGDWLERWEHPEILPGWVRISVRGQETVWPDVVIQLHEATPGAADL